jgi:hypothetical protein
LSELLYRSAFQQPLSEHLLCSSFLGFVFVSLAILENNRQSHRPHFGFEISKPITTLSTSLQSSHPIRLFPFNMHGDGAYGV